MNASDNVWDKIKHDLSLQMTEATFDTWLRNSSLISEGIDRLTVAVGLDYAWYSKDPESGALPFQKEFELSANLAWNLTPHLDLVGGTAWGLDNQVFRTRLGARLTLKAAH